MDFISPEDTLLALMIVLLVSALALDRWDDK